MAKKKKPDVTGNKQQTKPKPFALALSSAGGDGSSGDTPTKEVLVAATVAAQLRHDTRWPPNDVTKVMGTDYHYQPNTMFGFLVAVQGHLRHGTPSHEFQFDMAFAGQALQMTVFALMGAINDATT